MATVSSTMSIAWAQDAVWIDVATQQDFANEHVVDALHIPYTHIARGVSARFPDKKTPLKLYDRNQVSAEQAQEALQTLGYVAVTNKGALEELKAMGLATEQALEQRLSQVTAEGENTQQRSVLEVTNESAAMSEIKPVDSANYAKANQHRQSDQ